MYEELVKKLRTHAEDHCPLDRSSGICGWILAYEAADAIEELQQTVEHYKGCADDWYKEACDYKAQIPRWISVTERRPESYVDVLAFDGDVIGIAAYREKGQFWMSYWVFDDITHWMPLPTPPKEET